MLVAAYAGITELVAIDSLVDAMRATVPAYRRQHLEANERALRAGYAAAPRAAAPAFGGGEAV